MPRISVVIPSYNHATHVEQAIRSVCEQDHPDVELVVIDDGSTDGSVERIRRAVEQAKLSRVVVEEQENAGAHAAIMRGLELASGDCLTILNSDDFYMPGRLRQIAEIARGRERYLIFTGVCFVDEASEPLDAEAPHVVWYERMLQDLQDAPTVGFALLSNNLAVTSGNLAFSRALYREIGGFASLRFCHDWDFLMRATRLVEPIRVSERLIGYRVHAENSTHSLRDVQEEEAGTALNRYLDLCRSEGTPNPRAPCEANWPEFFPLFIAERPFHFGARPIADYLRRDAGTGPAGFSASL